MKILFDTDVIHYPLRGIGRYAYEIGNRLTEAPDIEKILYLHDGVIQPEMTIKANSAVQAEKARVRIKRWAGSMSLFSKAYGKLVASQQERNLSALSDERYIFHGPNFSLPVYDGVCITTFHHLSVFFLPECHPKKHIRNLIKEMQLSVNRAHVIITHSEFTRKEVAARFDFPIHRIVVAPLAVSSAYRPMSRLETMPVLSRMGLEYRRYSLFAGTVDSRKNIDGLLTAYERLPGLIRHRFPLVFVGFDGFNNAKTIDRIKSGESAGWARYLGSIDEAAMPALYAGARVFLFPSYYEGFGLPVLEAMTCGVPVICSDAPSLIELTQDRENNQNSGATLIPADNVNALYNAIEVALNDDTWCDNARQGSLQRASHFSWDKTISATLLAYSLGLQSRTKGKNTHPKLLTITKQKAPKKSNGTPDNDTTPAH